MRRQSIAMAVTLFSISTNLARGNTHPRVIDSLPYLQSCMHRTVNSVLVTSCDAESTFAQLPATRIFQDACKRLRRAGQPAELSQQASYSAHRGPARDALSKNRQAWKALRISQIFLKVPDRLATIPAVRDGFPGGQPERLSCMHGAVALPALPAYSCGLTTRSWRR